MEGYFSLLKQGLAGTYHHVSAHHLHRYLDEFHFRYNAGKMMMQRNLKAPLTLH